MKARKASKKIWMLLTVILTISSFTVFSVVPASASTAWPTRPINLVIGFAAGGTSDILGRVLAREMEEYLGVNVIAVNVTGASAAIAGRTVLESPADGYTLLSAVVHNPSGWGVMGFADIFWTDFYGLTTGTSPFCVVVARDARWQTIEELVDEARANPNTIRWSSAGFGSIGHLAGELFVQSLGMETQHIGYDGGREAVLRVMGGDVDFNLAGHSDIADLIEAGEVRVLGFMTQEDVKVYAAEPYVAPALLVRYPELQVAAELRSVWGVFIPRQTPPEVVARITEAVEHAMRQPRFIEAFESRHLSLIALQGEESDVLSARLESLFAWGLYDKGVASTSPAEFQIPRIEDFQWPPHDRARDANPWPGN